MQSSCVSSIMRVQKPKMTPLYNLLQKMCKQITNILSIRSDKDRHLRFPVFRASAQGGDRYPKHGTDQSDRVLPQDRRRPDRTGKAGVRCPRSRSNPANQIAELPHKPKAGAFGCGHRNRERKKQRVTLPVIPLCFFHFSRQTNAFTKLVYISPYDKLRTQQPGSP